MKLYDTHNNNILDIEVDDSSYRHRVIKGENSLTLKFSLAEHVELPVGCYCLYQGERYTLERPESLKMRHTRYFEYTVTMEAYQAKSKIWKFRNTVDGRLKFPLTAKPIEHLQMFVDNMNRRDSGWVIGECIDDVEHLISYDHDFCWDALGKMATEFKTEFEIRGKKVSLRKVEYNKNNPLPLSYGHGNGFKSGVGRSNSGNTPPVEILYVQGGTQNIDRSKYGGSELHLPKNQTIDYDGEHFGGELGFNTSTARRYVVDGQGMSIRRADKSLSSLAEDSLDCSDIYPKRVGMISDVVVVNEKNHFYDIIDTSIPATLNYKECRIDGEKMTIIFQSGMLAGREFEVEYYHTAVKGKAARRFEIVPQEIDGVTMPNATFAPRKGDKYAVFKCMLPQSYICDNATKTGAEWDMFKTAVKYLFNNEEQKFTFTGELDGIWAKKDWVNIGGRIVLGGYILFRDDRFQKEGVLVRITGIKDYINNPHSPTIEISNNTVSGSFVGELKKLQSEEVLVEDKHQRALQFTKRRFRDVKETMSMLEQNLLENFTNSISPIAIQTMQLLLGDESLQFRFVASAESDKAVSHEFNYDVTRKVFSTQGGIIQHLTLGINNVSAIHRVSEYKTWDISDYISPVLDDESKKYYLYIKAASKGTKKGNFILSENVVKIEEINGYYHFLVGILGSEYKGERSFTALYGFTEILPGRITTDRIISADGKTCFDLVENVISGNINFIDGLISGLIGVGNRQGINAGLNGEGESDTAVRFWAGDTSVNKETAPFRVLHNGKMYARNADIEGVIRSSEGVIGDFEISENSLESKDEDNSLLLSKSIIRYDGENVGGHGGKASVKLGSNVLPAFMGGDVAAFYAMIKNNSDSPYFPNDNIGAFFDVSGENNKNYAIFANQGKFAGLRPETKVLASSEELSKVDHTILVLKTCLVTLPDDPEDGQEYIIINMADYSIRSKATGKQITRYYYGTTAPGNNIDIAGNAFVARAIYFSGIIVNGKKGAWVFIHNVQY